MRSSNIFSDILTTSGYQGQGNRRRNRRNRGKNQGQNMSSSQDQQYTGTMAGQSPAPVSFLQQDHGDDTATLLVTGPKWTVQQLRDHLLKAGGEVAIDLSGIAQKS